jgi:hypothetical protein
LNGKGLRLFYLPTYSPQLNDVEAVFQVMTHYELPKRSYTTLDELVTAVRSALHRLHLRLLLPGQHLCPWAQAPSFASWAWMALSSSSSESPFSQ